MTTTQSSIMVVCPSCETINRVPAGKLASGEKPKCGQCGVTLFNGQPIEIKTAQGFEKHAGRNDIPLVVDFWASWCGPCKMMAPYFASAAARIEPRVRFAKVDTEALPQVAQRYNIRGIPTLILLRGGREISRKSGVMDASAIERWIESELGRY